MRRAQPVVMGRLILLLVAPRQPPPLCRWQPRSWQGLPRMPRLSRQRLMHQRLKQQWPAHQDVRQVAQNQLMVRPRLPWASMVEAYSREAVCRQRSVWKQQRARDWSPLAAPPAPVALAPQLLAFLQVLRRGRLQQAAHGTTLLLRRGAGSAR